MEMGIARVEVDDTRGVLTIRDFGNGFPSEVLDPFWKTGNVAVGLAGIRERLKELGGRLEIESNRGGTLLRAMIPASAKETQESEAAMFHASDLSDDAKPSSLRKARMQ